MGKDNNREPDSKVPIPYIPEDEKEADPSDRKAPSVKQLLDIRGKAIDNLTIQVQPIFNGGTNEPYEELTRPFDRGNSVSQVRS
jgi:hypothetical protein